MRAIELATQKLGEESVVAVTGASGLLGANFALRTSGELSLTALHHSHPICIPGVRCLALDLTDRELTQVTLDSIRPQVLFHFAAATNVDWCEDNPREASIINVDATRHLAEWAAGSNALMVLMSTDSVFDGLRGNYTERDSPGPLNAYGRSKLAAEEVVRQLSPEHLVIRSNIFGWNAQPKQSLAEWVLGLLESGKSVPAFTDTVFSPLFVTTLSEQILQLVRSGARGTWHLASKAATSKYSFARAMAESFGYDPGLCVPTLVGSAGFRARRPLNTSLDASKASDEFGIRRPDLLGEIDRFRRFRDEGHAIRLRVTYSPPS